MVQKKVMKMGESKQKMYISTTLYRNSSNFAIINLVVLFFPFLHITLVG